MMRVQLTRRLGQNKEHSVIEVSESEAEWLIDRGHAKPVKESKSKGDSEPSLGELRDQAERMGLDTRGSKAQLQARISEA